MSKVLIVQWTGSDHNSLRGLLDLAAYELGRLGHTFETVVVGEPGWEAALRNMLQVGGFHFALGMSGIGCDLRVDQTTLLWERLQLPFFTWFCDHPAYFAPRHLLKNRFIFHGYIFPDHAEYNQKYLNPNGMAFVGHIGIPTRRPGSSVPLPLAKRNGRLLFAKGAGDPERFARAWPAAYPPIIVTLLQECAEALRTARTDRYVETITQIAAAHNILLSPQSALMFDCIREIDRYARSRMANALAKTLLKYPIDFFGDWEHLDFTNANATFGKTIDFNTLREVLPSYLSYVSINPLTSGSAHDRTFQAIGAGVVPIFDANPYTRATFPLLADYSYDFESLDVDAAVDRLLSNPQQGLDVVEHTYEQAMPAASMSKTMAEVEQFCRLSALNLRVDAPL